MRGGIAPGQPVVLKLQNSELGQVSDPCGDNPRQRVVVEVQFCEPGQAADTAGDRSDSSLSSSRRSRSFSRFAIWEGISP